MADKEKQRIDRVMQESQEVVQKQEQVKDEIAKINEKGSRVLLLCVCVSSVPIFRFFNWRRKKKNKGESMNQKLNELDQELILAEKRCRAAKESEEIAVPKIK